MEILNRFTAGMIQDQLESFSNPESYFMARNAIHSSRYASGFGIVNEEGNELFAKFGGTIKGHSQIEERNQTLFFVYNGASELWLMDNQSGNTQFVCSDKEFGCNWGFDGCEFLYGEFKQFNACNELHVYWSSDCIYHVVNIDEMLNPKRKSAVKSSEDCSYFDMFRATCGVHISAMPSHNSGSTLEGGIVQFAVQFKDNDGNETNVFDISQPVVIETPDNIGGQIAKSSARLRVDGLSKHWNDVTIYVIHTASGITTIRKMPSASYGDQGFSFEYYGQKGELVDVSVVTNKKKAWLRGQDLLQHDGRMFFYNIKNERNLNYQKYANAINVEWVEYEVSMEQQTKYHFPSLMRGEVYAIGIVWKYVDGTYSPVFHIPSCGGGAQSLASAVSGDGSAVTSSGSTKYCFDGDGNCVSCTYCLEGCTPCDPGGEGKGGSTGSGGGKTDGGASSTYNPLRASDFQTDKQFERKRNPSDVKDRPNESKKLQEQTYMDAQKINTNEEEYMKAADCEACTKECLCCDCGSGGGQTCTTVDGDGNIIEETTCTSDGGEAKDCDCSALPSAVSNDIHDVFNPIENNAELLALYGKDYPDPNINQTGNLKDAALSLIDNAVVQREYITRKRPILTYSGSTQAGPGKSPEDPKSMPETQNSQFKQKGVGVSNVEQVSTKGASIRGDNWVDGQGNPLTEEPPRVIGSGATIPWTSTIKYPDHKDCDGNHFYPQGSICHHQIPWTSQRPHFVSFQNGVVNKYQPENYEYGKTYTRPIGLRLNNIKFPSQDELPKPLCPKSPFKVVYVKRTSQNKRIFAKGWLSGTFDGEVYGAQYKYPRHGVNSFEHVDRSIAKGDGLSRMGSKSNDPVYTFHSPDTDCDNSYLPVTKCKSELALRGSGWRHGLYSEGKKPVVDQWNGTQKDNRGARVSNNLNHYTPGGGSSNIVGITYAPANTVVSPASGMSKPLMNKFRESSIYLQTSGNMAGDSHDKSFVGDVMDHFAPTTANAPYVALWRELPDQYGSVQGLKYIDLGLSATQAHANGLSSIEGICGDVWIGPYSKRRTSYVSNKQGDFYNPPAKPGSPCRRRSWCDSPDDKIFQYFGIDHYPTKLPKSGDLWDPKNYAGLHTVGGNCGEFGKSKTAAEAAGTDTSESDFYGPRTLKSLVHTIVESHVNPWLMETGEGSQLQEGKVYYPKLKDLYLDADAPTKHPWEESFLSRFYGAIEQPSKKKLWLKMSIRTFINGILPAGLLTQFQNMETVLDTVSTFMVSPMLMAMWILSANTLFTDRRLNQMLGIGECLRDEEGGDLDELIENFEDAYSHYNWDYSRVNEIQPYYAFPLPYNTCDCDSCDKDQTNNEIYHSNKQNLDTEIDAYRNVKINNYNEIPASSGKLRRLFVQGNGFYAHTTDGIWVLQLKQESFSNQIAFQQSGNGELLAEPQLLFEGVEEGFLGTQHPNAGINTAFGYFFIDDNAKKVYRFNGTPEEISAYGMYHFFKENLGFCNPKACYDEKTNSGIHYALGWDPRYNRLLLTKQDGDPCNSFTISYTPVGGSSQGGGAMGKWVSFHDYKPQAYIWDRDSFFSVLYGKGEVWKHHSRGTYQSFYGELQPFEIQFTAVPQTLESFNFESLILDTEGEIDTTQRFPKRDVDATFNKVALWNSTEGTGILPIIHVSDDFGGRKSQNASQNYGQVFYNKNGRIWRANAFKNLVLTDCDLSQMLITECGCQVIPDINQEIFDCSKISKQDFINRNLNDNHLTIRYTLDNRSDMRLYVKQHKVFDNTKPIEK